MFDDEYRYQANSEHAKQLSLMFSYCRVYGQPVAITKIPRDKVAQWQIIENHLVPLEVALMMRYKVCLTFMY